MAIEHRALFALSIAFTASIVAFPDLPPDIPPRAGVDGAFVGAPFVAFLLPVAATAIWWIVASLGPSPRSAQAASCRERRRGDRAVPVGVSRDDAHRVHRRPAVAGPDPGRDRRRVPDRDRQSPCRACVRICPGAFVLDRRCTSDDLWRRVHRLGGYIRVMMGIVLCVAALSGMGGLRNSSWSRSAWKRWSASAPAVFLSRRNSALVGVLLIGCCGIGMRAQAQGMTPQKIAALPALLDAIVPKLHGTEATWRARPWPWCMTDGSPMLRGYGKARLDSGASVDPSRTAFSPRLGHEGLHRCGGRATGWKPASSICTGYSRVRAGHSARAMARPRISC